MANAYKDENGVSTLIASSSVDGKTPVRVYADPDTHRLLVDATAGVVGPGSSTDNAVARFDGTTGQTIQNSTAILTDAGVLTTAELHATNGASGTFTTVDLKTVTVVDGIITSIV